jgi:chromosome segregation ATPase
MARPGITAKEVAAVANAIKARGQTPTIAAVRNELGSGSFTTIAQYLAAWKNEASLQAEEDTPLPASVENEALKAITAIWRVATNEYRDELNTLRAKHEDEKKELASERDQALAEVQRLEEAQQRMNNDIEKRETELKEAAQEHMRLLGTITGLQAAIEQLKQPIKQQAAKSPASDTKTGTTKPTRP